MAIEAGDAIWRVRADLSDLRTKMGSAKGLVKGTMDGMVVHARGLGIAMTAAGGAIVGTLGFAAKSAATFGTEMAAVATLGVKDLDAVSDAVKDTAAAFGLDLSDGAKAAYQAISAGASEAEVPKVLEMAALGAAAGQAELTESIELGMGTMNAFGLEVKDMESIYDSAFVAVKQGVTTFGELASTTGKLAPIFNAAGLSVDDMFGSIAALTKGGIATAEAVTGLKAAMTNIIKPNRDAKAISKALGIEFSSAAVATEGWEGWLAKLKKGVEENGDELIAHKAALEKEKEALEASGNMTKTQKQRYAALKKELKELKRVGGDHLSLLSGMFGSTEAVASILGLTGTQAESFTGIMGNMNEKLGSSREAFQAIVDNDPAFAWRQLRSELSVLAVEIGQTLMPAGKALVGFLKPIVGWLRDFTRAAPGVTTGLITIAGAVGVFMLAAGPLLIMLPGLLSLLGVLGGGGAAAAVGGAAAAGGTAAGGVGLAGVASGFWAAAAGAGSFALALAPVIAVAVATGFAVHQVFKETAALQIANEDLVESEHRLSDSLGTYANQLRENGVVVDQWKMKKMNADEQIQYMSQQRSDKEGVHAKLAFERIAKRTATDKEYAQMQALSLNEWMSAEEAARILIEKVDTKLGADLIRTDKMETDAILVQLGIREQSHLTYEDRIRDLMDVSDDYKVTKVETTTQLWALSYEEMYARMQLQAAQAEAAEVASMERIIQKAKEATAAVAQAGGGGGGFANGGVVPGFANGGVVQGLANGGLVKVGERGEEMVSLPVGSRVMSHEQMKANVPGEIVFSGNTFNVRDESDIQKVGHQLLSLIRQEKASRGVNR